MHVLHAWQMEGFLGAKREQPVDHPQTLIGPAVTKVAEQNY